MLRRWTIAILLAGIVVVKAQLGTIQTNVPWRAGHVAGNNTTYDKLSFLTINSSVPGSLCDLVWWS